MSKLIFTSSVMNSGKTARLLQLNFDYNNINKKTILFKPALDDRESVIKSRNGLESECVIINDIDDFNAIDGVDMVFIDEAQFLKRAEVDRLREIATDKNIIVHCFGLKSDFKGNLFEGSQRLIELADSIEELSTICLCGEKATMNLKYDNKSGNVIKSGNTIDCGYEDMYMSVCYKHWNITNVSEIK